MQGPTFPFGTILRQEGRFQLVVGNEPKNLPGCYGIYDLRNGKWCVGTSTSVRRRRAEHEGDIRGRTLLHQIVSEADSLESFVYVPLYYFIITRKMLEEAEAAMILGMDSLVPNGYNAYASRSDPGYWQALNSPAAHAKAYATRKANGLYERNILNTPEVQARAQKTLSDPIIRKRRVETRKITTSTDEYKERHAAIMAEIHARPEVQKKRGDSVTASWERRRQKYGPSGRP